MSLRSRISRMAEDRFARIADGGGAEGVVDAALQGAMGVLAPAYGAGAWANRMLHDLGVRPRAKLPAVVLSVGNLTLGGTGKTPFCAWLVRHLRESGRVPAILSRGYGRDAEDRLVVVHDGRTVRATAEQAGDEPMLLARMLGDTPVIACADRARGGRAALKRFAADTLVLDDGFQHVALERQGDFVLVDATRPVDGLKLFPRGTLREPLGALERAHLAVLTRCDDRDQTARATKFLKSRFPGLPVVRTRMEPARLARVRDGQPLAVGDLKGHDVFLACGVGNPEAVRRTVESLGARVVRFETVGDHGTADMRTVSEWEHARRRAGARFLVVTEKDAVKLREVGGMPKSMVALGIDLRFVGGKDEETARKVVASRLRAGALRGYIS